MDIPQPDDEWRLARVDGRLQLQSKHRGGRQTVAVDYLGGKLGYSRRVPGSLMLYRAIGTHHKNLIVIDATAGLGGDAFRLLLRGCIVTAIERQPMVAALLEDGVRRAVLDPELREMFEKRFRLVATDARDYLRGLDPLELPDVVYVDPMFPPSRHTAAVKKEAEALRSVVGADEDADELLAAARHAARRHVVVKRMLRSPALAPDIARTYKGKSTRYDVYLPFTRP